ncbi:MAG: SHOCT domain-containing protein [archaeon]|nr:SHOCT domain-containing protein [archaeon]
MISNNQEKTDSIITNTDELLKYAELYEKGLLTKEEFENKKRNYYKITINVSWSSFFRK